MTLGIESQQVSTGASQQVSTGGSQQVSTAQQLETVTGSQQITSQSSAFFLPLKRPFNPRPAHAGENVSSVVRVATVAQRNQ